MGCSPSSASLTRPQSQSAASSSGSQAPLHPAGHPSTPARPPMPLTKQLRLHSDSSPLRWVTVTMSSDCARHRAVVGRVDGCRWPRRYTGQASAVVWAMCMHTHPHACAHTNTCTHTYTHMCAHRHMHTHACTHMYTRTHPHTCARTLACTQVHASAYMHTCTPAWMHAHAHPRACTTHTCACACIVNPHVCTAHTCAHAPTPMYMPHIHVCAHTCMHMLTCMHTHTHAEMSHHSDKGLHFVTPVECLFVFLYSFITGHVFNSFTEV